MSSVLIKNGCVVTLDEDNRILENTHILIENGMIKHVGASVSTADTIVDASGKIVMPGFINAHHHLYSSFARGFAPPGDAPIDFEGILESLWWKLDKALTHEDVYYSAMVALVESIKVGCTTIIDHHASPSCCDGSLDQIERAFRETGLNGCLCYEVTDRNKKGEGIEENERFIKKCLEREDDQISALFGLHASMTISDQTLEQCAVIMDETGCGCHVHAAEDQIDQTVTQTEFGKRVMQRFHDAGITGAKSLFVHGIHLDESEMAILKESDSIVVHNPESNMNNAVGVSPLLELLGRDILVGLGTDGMTSHMVSSARCAYLLQRIHQKDPRIAFCESAQLLCKNNRRIVRRVTGRDVGMLKEGCAADVVVLDYTPTTPLTPSTVIGHLLFGINYAPVDTTICRGRVLMQHKDIQVVEESDVSAHSREAAQKLWTRIT